MSRDATGRRGPGPAGCRGTDAGSIHLVHRHSGRIRLRSEAFTGSGPKAGAARDALSGMDGVLSVEHDPLTGSLLVRHDPDELSSELILHRIEHATGPPVAESPRPPARPLGSRVIDAASQLNAFVFELTGRRADLRTLVPATLAGLSVAILVFGEESRIPRWDSMAYWSVNLFTTLHSPNVQAASKASDARQSGAAADPSGARAGQAG